MVPSDTNQLEVENNTGLACAQSLSWLCKQLEHVCPTSVPLPKSECRQLAFQVHRNPAPVVLRGILLSVFRRMGYEDPLWSEVPDEKDLPMVAIVPELGYRVVSARASDGAWIVDGPDGRERFSEWPESTLFSSAHGAWQGDVKQTAREMFVRAFRKSPGWMFYAVLASLLTTVLALATSIYSMQVYDRVVGSGATATLVVLTVGVGIAILIEFFVKLARSRIVEYAMGVVDYECAYGVFSRLLGIRYDQRPGSVGTLAAQVRSYETVRTFAVSLALFVVSDGPFALLFLLVIFMIAGPVVSAVPLTFLVVAIMTGLMFRRRIERAAEGQAAAGNRRHGLLVEAIEGGECVKANGYAWRVLGRWNDLSRQNINENRVIKQLGDVSTYTSGMLQQISYVGLVAAGAWIAATTNDLTTGGIIACSILSGRVLAPVSMVPGLLVQWSHAKVALNQLEQLFGLQQDNHGVNQPLNPDSLSGDYELSDVMFSYPGQLRKLSIPKFSVRAGEKVAILGTVGVGKSTLIRLIAGISRPQRGQVLVDGLDIYQIGSERRAELIGYLPQQIVLFGGTLRENLLAGLPPIDDSVILQACRATGLIQIVSSRSEGLDLQISEGGGGLSGGQKQLVGLTRLLLSPPKIWLMDEPTAAMDETTEMQCWRALTQRIQKDQTLILVTHKFALLGLVDRVVVLAPEGVVLDGPRDAVVAKLRQKSDARSNVVTGAAS